MPFGRLPGDFAVRRGNFSFYFPLATSIVVSILLTLLLFFALTSPALARMTGVERQLERRDD